MSKYTEYFPGHIRPARSGVYERKFAGDGRFLSNWNGYFWGCNKISAAAAYLVRDVKSFDQNIPWRGLAKEPHA